MASFDKAFEVLIGNEGGYNDLVSDPGNWTGGKIGAGLLKGTKYGIAASSHPNYDIFDISLDEAKAIYFKDYWAKIMGNILPWAVAINVFDMAVQSGVIPAIKMMQRVLNTTQDGVIGPLTLAAANAANPDDFSSAFYLCRMNFLHGLSIWNVFSKGLTNRLVRINEIAQDSEYV